MTFWLRGRSATRKSTCANSTDDRRSNRNRRDHRAPAPFHSDLAGGLTITTIKIAAEKAMIAPK